MLTFLFGCVCVCVCVYGRGEDVENKWQILYILCVGRSCIMFFWVFFFCFGSFCFGSTQWNWSNRFLYKLHENNVSHFFLLKIFWDIFFSLTKYSADRCELEVRWGQVLWCLVLGLALSNCVIGFVLHTERIF